MPEGMTAMKTPISIVCTINAGGQRQGAQMIGAYPNLYALDDRCRQIANKILFVTFYNSYIV